MIIAKIIIECVYEQKITKDKFKYHITWKKMTCTDAWPPAHRSVKHCVTKHTLQNLRPAQTSHSFQDRTFIL